MQPILSITAPLPGVVSVNGRFAGETAPDAPLLLPVAPSGALFLRFEPLEPDCLPLTRRFTLSGGGVLPQALARDVYAVAWPGGVTELEFAPLRLPLTPRRQTRLEDGISYALVEAEPGGAPALAVGALEIVLPRGALLPELRRRDGLLLFSGRTSDGGRYLAVASGDAARALGVIRGRLLEIAGATVRALVAEDDLVGHARLETWQLGPEVLALESTEPVWAEGAPRWPQTAEDTVLAALQAAFLGLVGEAAAYLAPALAASGVLQRCAHEFGGVTALKYAPPDARSAVGLLRAEAPNFARVTPVYYRAAPMGGAQGPWRIERLQVGEE